MAPLFGIAPGTGVQSVEDGSARSINLDDIFADCFFLPGDSGAQALDPAGGGMKTAVDSTQGRGPPAAGTAEMLAQQLVQPSAFMGGRLAAEAAEDDGSEEEEDDDPSGDKKRKRPRPQLRQMTEQQKVERR